jgi:hypothetical protein
MHKPGTCDHRHRDSRSILQHSNTPLLQFSITPLLLNSCFHSFICNSAKALRSSALTSETAQNTNPSCSQWDTL